MLLTLSCMKWSVCMCVKQHTDCLYIIICNCICIGVINCGWKNNVVVQIVACLNFYIYIYIYISGGPLSALTCCVNVRLLSAIKKISPLIYSQSWVGSWVYTTQAMMTFTLIF